MYMIVVTAQILQKFKNCFRRELFDCLIVCGVCIPDLSIGDYFPPLISYRTETDPCRPDTRPLRHRVSPDHRRETARDQPQPTERKTPFNNQTGYFYSAPEIVLETVPA